MGSQQIAGDQAPLTLAFLLSQVGIHASKQFAERIVAIGLQPPLFRVLNLVDAAEGESQQAIAKAVDVPASRMVALVDELEREGLVERRPHPSDRRIRALYLTGKGRGVLAKGRKIAKQHETDLTRGMSATDRKALTRLLQQIVAQQGLGDGVHPGLSGRTGAGGQSSG